MRREVARPRAVVVVGTGLIGTSAALALRRAGAGVWLSDADPAAATLAAELGAGPVLPGAGGGCPAPPRPGAPRPRGWGGGQVLPVAGVPGGPADVAVIAVPPASVAA